MKMRKFLQGVLACTMILSMNTIANASEVVLEKEVASVESLVQSNSLVLDGNIARHSMNLEESINSEGIQVPLSMVSSRAVSGSWTETLASQGQYSFKVVTLAPNQIVNATLECPLDENLNYNLYIYEVDSNGYLTSLVAGSETETYMNTYPDSVRKTLDEGAAYVNRSSETKTYAVGVHSARGGSSTSPYTLNVSLDVAGAFDAAEPNDSPYAAYVLNSGSIGISGASIHAMNDQDWFQWSVPTGTKSAKISVDLGYDVEVYSVANGNQMVLVNAGEESFDTTSGAYYLKIYSKTGATSTQGYTMNIQHTFEDVVSSFSYQLKSDKSSDFATYYERTAFRFEDYFTATGQVLSSNGNGVDGHRVVVGWESGAWTAASGNQTRTAVGYTDENGNFSITLKTPTSLGSNSCLLTGPINFLHKFDICWISVIPDGFEYQEEGAYHFSHSQYLG